MKALIEHVAQALVDHPEQVSVAEEEADDTTSIKLSVAPDDLGKVIGRRGRTASAMRTILAATAARKNVRAVLEILE
ncbi:MAG: KH domain-containing protein [Nitrospinae bacterium]|nr:KH domain-containing protein [Nitrospinota bacterium]